MRLTITRLELILVGLALSTLAIIAPLPLYLVALILFGLPHVLWELNWVKHTYGYQLPPLVWWLWGVILGIQALGRLGVWLGGWSSTISSGIDISTLGLLLAVSFYLGYQQQSTRLRFKLSLLVLAVGGIYLALQQHNIVGVLLILAILHNFTPLFLAQSHQYFDQLPATRTLKLLFSLPFLVALLVTVSGYKAESTINFWLPTEAVWLQTWVKTGFNAVLSGLVLSQCLHYYSVLRLMPSTLPKNTIQSGQVLAVILSALLTLYFIDDFNHARQLYSVASGVHAWLELPLIALLLTGVFSALAKPASGATSP